MLKVRTIMRPVQEGENVTLAQARAVFRELKRKSDGDSRKKTAPRKQKSAAKAE